MPADPLIENLLILQERDVRRDELQHRLDDIPQQLASFDKDTTAAKALYQKTLDEQKSLELIRRDLERRMNEAEAEKIRFKTQQITVKKNEEYAALEKQIEATSKLIDETETQAMEAMLKIDEYVKFVKNSKTTCDTTIAAIAEKAASVNRLKAEIEKDIVALTAEVETAKKNISADALSAYAYVKTRVKRPPYIVPVNDMRCMGCHLKISNDVQNQVHVTGKITRCESCGRIVYLER
jgi:predicted  nucleic acid-binding Zn-ribbon protein